MKTQTDKAASKKSKAVANTSADNRNQKESKVQFEDNRAEAVAQRQLGGMADNSAHASKVAQLQAIANDTSPESVQKQGLEEEEELLQGKFETIQKQPEEEELLQGKLEAIQRQGLEEEEPLQGKFETVQKQEEEEELQMKSETIQRQGAEEEEPLQGKFETIQKQEEEEELQMKSETIQRQGPEEEELLQGKFETIQRRGAEEEEELLQGKFETIQKQGLEEEEIQAKSAVVQKSEDKHANNTGLPDTLKSGIENLSGLSLDDVKVHYNSPIPAQLQAHAFAQGTDIHMAPGQEKHLPHEAWHVVQQKQGRVKPTKQMKGKVDVNDDAGLEKEADVMGARALQKNSDQLIVSSALAKPDLKTSQLVTQRVKDFYEEDFSGNEVGNKEAVEELETSDQKEGFYEKDFSGLLLNKEANNQTVDTVSGFMSSHFDNSWELLQAAYRNEKLAYEETDLIGGKPAGDVTGMKKLLDCRQELTNKIIKAVEPAVLEKVKSERKNLLLEKEIIIERDGKISLNPETSNEMKSKGNALLQWAEKPKPLDGGAAGSESATSDIDVSLTGDGTDIAVGMLNKEFSEKYGDGKIMGEVWDVNFYAAAYVTDDAVLEKYNIEKPNEWRPHELKPGSDLAEELEEDERINALLHVKVDNPGMWKPYKEASKMSWGEVKYEANKTLKNKEKVLIADEVEIRDKERTKTIAAKKPADAKDVQPGIKEETAAYEDILKEVNEARKEYEFLKITEPDSENTSRAYVKLRKLLTKEGSFANEALYTSGSIIAVVVNKQKQSKGMLNKEQILEKEREKLGEKGKEEEVTVNTQKPKVKQTWQEWHHSTTENMGRAIHAIKDDDIWSIAKKAGKYIHRHMNAAKHMLEEQKDMGGEAWVIDETKRKAAADLEGIKQRQIRKAEGKGFEAAKDKIDDAWLKKTVGEYLGESVEEENAKYIATKTREKLMLRQVKLDELASKWRAVNKTV